MRKRTMLITVIIGILILLALGFALIWIGMQIEPSPFPDYPATTPPLATIPLPDDLPAPVARFYRTITGEDNAIPVIESAVFTGSAQMRLNGIRFRARFRFTHVAGLNYRHYIEGTTWGFPLLKVNERYLDGVSRMELPVGTVEDNPYVNAAANQGLWAESLWLPSIYLTDPRVRWEAVDDTTARLIVPFEGEIGDGTQTFTAYFDADTGLITHVETMRYKGESENTLAQWTIRADRWETMHGIMIPVKSSAQWADEDGPWAIFTIEDVVYNVDVSEYVQQKGL
jgi:hypothetical protein